LPAPPVASGQLPSHAPVNDPVVLAGQGLSKAVWIGGGVAALVLVGVVAFLVSSSGVKPLVTAAPPPAPVLGVVVTPPPQVEADPPVKPPPLEVEKAPLPIEHAVKAEHNDDPGPKSAGRNDAVVSFKTEPTTEVYVDGKKRGSTPLELKLAPGRHQLKFVNNGLKFSRSQSLVLSPGEQTEVGFQAKRGKLAIHAEPFADMYVDGKQVTSLKSFSEIELWDGRYVVKVSNQEMGKSQEKTIELKNGQDAEVRFNLLQQ
jgi:uncharacterized iron-regulated membrane protein